jgi:hypothetical protein
MLVTSLARSVQQITDKFISRVWLFLGLIQAFGVAFKPLPQLRALCRVAHLTVLFVAKVLTPFRHWFDLSSVASFPDFRSITLGELFPVAPTLRAYETPFPHARPGHEDCPAFSFVQFNPVGSARTPDAQLSAFPDFSLACGYLCIFALHDD